MENVLKARIVGDISDYKAKMAEAERITESATKEIVNLEGALAGLKAEYKAGSIDVDQYSKQLAKLNNQLQDQRQVLNNARGSMRAIGGDVNQATGTFQELNRVIQDAPFGIIGVGNNLQQLAGSFGQLSQQAGGTRAALALTFKSLISGINPAILAVSAITTAFTLYQMGVFGSKEKTDEAKDSLEKYNEELRNTIQSLSAFEKASLKSAQNVEKEKIQVDSLFSILRDSNQTQDVRIGAYNKLISIYPGLLKGLTQEKALAGDLTEEYNLLAQAIEKKALSSALEGEFVSLVKDRLELEKQFNKEVNSEFELQNKLFEVRQKIARAEGEGSDVARGARIGLRNLEEDILEQLEKQRQVVSLTESLITAQGSEAQKLRDQIVELSKELFIVNGEFETSNSSLTTANTEAEKLKRTFEDINKLPSIGIPGQNREDLIKQLRERRRQLTEGGQVNQTGPEFIQDQLQKVIDQGIITERPFDAFGNNAVENFDKIKIGIDELGAAFNGVGTLIGKAFGNNPALGQFVSQFVSFAAKLISTNFSIASSNAVTGASSAAVATGPAAPFTLPAFIATSLGLVASAFAAFGGGKGGGGGSSPTLGQGSSFTNRREFGGPVAAGRAYIVGEKRPEIFVPNTNGTIIPKMPDMNYGGMANGRASGMNVNLSGSFRIDKNDLLYVIEQGLVERRLT